LDKSDVLVRKCRVTQECGDKITFKRGKIHESWRPRTDFFVEKSLFNAIGCHLQLSSGDLDQGKVEIRRILKLGLEVGYCDNPGFIGEILSNLFEAPEKD
jgi:hypothetical protein